MNQNRIFTDRFSNPITECAFRETTPQDEQPDPDPRRQACACCLHRWVLGDPADSEWVLCLNRQSPHCHETLSAQFTCPQQAPSAW